MDLHGGAGSVAWTPPVIVPVSPGLSSLPSTNVAPGWMKSPPSIGHRPVAQAGRTLWDDDLVVVAGCQAARATRRPRAGTGRGRRSQQQHRTQRPDNERTGELLHGGFLSPGCDPTDSDNAAVDSRPPARALHDGRKQPNPPHVARGARQPQSRRKRSGFVAYRRACDGGPCSAQPATRVCLHPPVPRSCPGRMTSYRAWPGRSRRRRSRRVRPAAARAGSAFLRAAARACPESLGTAGFGDGGSTERSLAVARCSGRWSGSAR